MSRCVVLITDSVNFSVISRKLKGLFNLDKIVMKSTGKISRKGAAALAVSFAAITYSSIPEAEKKAMEKAEKGGKN